jgi:hypothetical protein
LSTSVKFDETVKTQNDIANFEETRCFCWGENNNNGEILCGKTGLRIVDDDEANLKESSFSLKRFVESVSVLNPTTGSLSKLKETIRFKYLTEHPLLFSTWPVCDFDDSFL